MLNPVTSDFENALRVLLPAAAFKDDTAPYLSEPRGRWAGQGFVVAPASTEEVSIIVRACAEAKIGIVPYSGGTGLVGGQLMQEGPAPVVLSLERMNKIRAVYPSENVLVCDAGTILATVQQAAEDIGRLFPLSLASEGSARIGGLLATNAGGVNVLRYGNARAHCLGLEVVRPDGSIWHGLTRLRKDNTGYDLRNLMIGAEGTLGIITELTLKLHGIPEQISSGVCHFPTVDDACNATILAIQSGLPLARIELLDALMAQATNLYSNTGYDERPTLMLEFHGSPASVAEQTVLFSEIAEQFGGTAIVWQETVEGRNAMWKARHDAYPAMLAYRPGSQGIATDACVPISRLADCLAETIADVEELKLVAPIIGHVGDGNFHVSPLVMMDDADEVARAETMIERLNLRCLAMEGTCTGEHGIGQGKRRFLRLEHGAGADVMTAIKAALDPNDIMNPGKVVGLD